jgi:hypothetical protein
MSGGIKSFLVFLGGRVSARHATPDNVLTLGAETAKGQDASAPGGETRSGKSRDTGILWLAMIC